MRAAVARYLDRRRSLTAEVHVVGPRYTTVTVHARLHVEPGTDVRGLRERARAALDEFLHPLRGGPDGAGWPIGRDVYRAEVLALLDSLPGVAWVEGLGLRLENEPGPRCGNIPLCPDSLVAAGPHRIEVVERSATP